MAQPVEKSRAAAQAAGGSEDKVALFAQRQRRAPHLILFVIAAFFVTAVGWASVATLDEYTRGEGKVVTSSHVQVVQNMEGGIVSEILVKEGMLVEKGQVLMRIDDTRFASAYREGQRGNLALKAKAARLEAEVYKKPFVIPDEVAKEDPTLAQNETALYRSRSLELQARNDILRQQLAQRRQELAEMQSRRDQLTQSFALVQKELSITAPLVKQGVMSEVELLRLEREVTRIKSDLDAATLAIPRLRAAIQEAQRKIDDNEHAFRSQAAAELAQAKAELAKSSEAMPALEDRLQRTTVRSPVKGLVKVLAVKTIGGVVQPGSTMVEVVPIEDTLLVETRINPRDIAFIAVGQHALVRLTAYDYSIYGGLEGKIEHISADTFVPEKSEPFYLAYVRTEKATLDYNGKALPIIPGMTASVDVLTGHKTVLDYLLFPVNRARQRALTER